MRRGGRPSSATSASAATSTPPMRSTTTTPCWSSRSPVSASRASTTSGRGGPRTRRAWRPRCAGSPGRATCGWARSRSATTAAVDARAWHPRVPRRPRRSERIYVTDPWEAPAGAGRGVARRRCRLTPPMRGPAISRRSRAGAAIGRADVGDDGGSGEAVKGARRAQATPRRHRVRTGGDRPEAPSGRSPGRPPDGLRPGARGRRRPSHVDSGMTPTRISRPNSQQPAQNPTTDSSVAKTTSTPAGPTPPRRRRAPRLATAADGGQRQPDRLGEPLRRAGHERRAGRAGGPRPGSPAVQRAQRRSGQHAGEEAEGERHQQPVPPGDERDEGDDGHAAGDDAGRLLVDRVGEAEDRRHEHAR